jgi:hypothetical protein
MTAPCRDQGLVHTFLHKSKLGLLHRQVLHVMTGEPYLMRLMGFDLVKPKNPVLGMDVAGTVIETGARVTRFKVGD